jgi:hypothetical protein
MSIQFSIDKFFQPHYGVGLIQPLTEMSIRNIPGHKELPKSKADNLTAICEPVF